MTHQCYAVSSNNWIPWTPLAISFTHGPMSALVKVHIIKRISQGRTETCDFPDSKLQPNDYFHNTVKTQRPLQLLAIHDNLSTQGQPEE